MKSRYRLALGLVAGSILFPCSFDTTPLFIPVHVPEKVAAAFVNGRLGIIVPTLSPRYKLIAWRYLSGLPLDQSQRDAIVRSVPADEHFRAPQRWREARKPYGPSAGYFFPDKQSRLSAGTYYEDCLPDAFNTAVDTLNDRRTRYENPDLVKVWVAAQDRVFENCHSDKANYPEDPEPSLPILARADRQYQIAAAHFYAEDFPSAERLFRAIANDSSSPWRDTAAYLIGRVLIREFTLANQAGALDRANAQLQTIPSGRLHDSARGLIRYIGSLQNPTADLQSLSGLLKQPNFAGPWREATYALTSNRFRKALAANPLPEPFEWIRSIESRDPAGALARWRDSHSVLWLTAAIVHTTGRAAEGPALIDAASKIPLESPAYDTVTYHSIRLLIESGKTTEARRRLDALLSMGVDLASLDNALRAQRMSLATSYDDFLRWAPRRPIGAAEGDLDLDPAATAAAGAVALDRDSADVFNYATPLSRLAEASQSNRLPEPIRSEIATAAWTRAFILGRDDIANRETGPVTRAHAKWTADLDRFRSATGDARRFAGAILIERHAEFSPTIWSGFRPNVVTESGVPDWWCVEPKDAGRIGPAPQAALSLSEQGAASDEVKRVRASGPAQTFLAPIVMSWAQSHPDDANVPEALHRLIRITRYGCREVGGNGAISKAAFDLLHRRYPNSPWTKQTPYWFDK
ncbi:MAG: hypothetical protein KGN84_01990 [Acidobacteriota bacterium]|nr:hypothetical protein [Acidobacteriota bacterium]